MSAALQIFSRDFDADFFELPSEVQQRIQSAVDRMGMMLGNYPHRRLKGVDAFRLRVGDYRVIYTFDQANGILYLLAIGHRREVYRK